MDKAKKSKIIALEEHYWDPEVRAALGPDDGMQPTKQLFDVGEERIRAMDDAGIDLQVLSMGAPATQAFDAKSSVPIAKKANDTLKGIINTHPERYAGFATLPTAAPEAAADELERSVKELGLKGAMLHGMSEGEKFLDLKEFWPIYERAAELDVPIYLHPGRPHPAIIGNYLKDYLKDFPAFIHAGWGFTIETATLGIRMVLSGVFQKHPRLKIILGHLGEGLPFLLWRMNHAFSRYGNDDFSFREIFREHFWVTTSGNFSDPALLCTLMELGADRIMFSVDYPYVENTEGTEWMETLSLSTGDLDKIYSGNAKRLLRL